MFGTVSACKFAEADSCNCFHASSYKNIWDQVTYDVTIGSEIANNPNMVILNMGPLTLSATCVEANTGTEISVHANDALSMIVSSLYT